MSQKETKRRTCRQVAQALMDEGVVDRQELVAGIRREQPKISARRILKVLSDLGVPCGPRSAAGRARGAKPDRRRRVSVEEYVDQHGLDYGKALRAELATFGDEEVQEDPDLRATLQVPESEWRHLRDAQEFREHQVMVRASKRRLWCKPAGSARRRLLELATVVEVY
jgi:hypothetical protein